MLSYEDFVEVINHGNAPCRYCEAKLSWATYCHSLIDRKVGYQLDRKDNNKGYTKENVVACCRACNYTKRNTYTFEEMLLLSPVLKFIREKRNEVLDAELQRAD